MRRVRRLYSIPGDVRRGQAKKPLSVGENKKSDLFHGTDIRMKVGMGSIPVPITFAGLMFISLP
jgi:hypothetical protein